MMDTIDYISTGEYEEDLCNKLLPCPFCGTHPIIKRRGNNFTKKRSITIKCPSCRIERTDAAIHQNMEWLEDVALKNWNQRPVTQLAIKG
jgi:Lar family restriction alleviation protein